MRYQYNYVGYSMNPTLKNGDALSVVPFEEGKMCVGDVVVFWVHEEKRHVAHRVVSLEARAVRTKGDNNNRIDSWILRPNDILGRVDSARRGDRFVCVHGGRRGIIYASLLRSVKGANLAISRTLRPAYNWLSKSGILGQFLPLRARLRIICFSKPSGVEMQLLMGRWMIGRRRPGVARWSIRRPFRLLIDDKLLPGTDATYFTSTRS